MTRLPMFVACSLLVAGTATAQPAPAAVPSMPPTSAAAQNPPAQAPKPPALPTTQTPAAPPKPQVPFATDTKVGFVNMQLVVSGSELGKKGGAALKAFQDRTSEEMNAKNKQISDTQKDIEQGRGVLSPSVLQSKTLDLQRFQRELDLIQKNADDQYQALSEQLLASFSERSMPIIEGIAKEKGLYLIVTEQSQIAYVSPAIDLTAEVVKRLDAAYPKDK